MHHRIDIRRRIFAGASVILTVLCTPVFVLFLILKELGDLLEAASRRRWPAARINFV
jgi:hypothetical protein